MREKLIQYVDLLFAGAEGVEEVKQEILQNTLDRYDDLVSQGKSPEAAYRLAMGGIGDVDELIGRPPAEASSGPEPKRNGKKQNRKLLTGIAIGLYILCPVPLFILQDEIGLCILLVIVAIATGILIMVGGEKAEQARKAQDRETELQKSISRLVSAITLTVYLILSFLTGAWHITWVIFPISAAVKGLIKAILDLKEEKKHEI